MSKWPRDNQAALIAFYGDPRTSVPSQLVDVAPQLPFRFTYDGKPIRHMMFHRKAAPALLSALQKIWDYYGRDQAVLDRLHISRTAGTFNPRMIRGSTTRWSNHAFGGAIDLDAEENGFNTGQGAMPKPVVAAFKSEGFRWGGDYSGRTDPMHFEACDNGQPARSFEQWLAFYHCQPSYSAPIGFADVVDLHTNGIVTDEAPSDQENVDEPIATPTDGKVVTGRTIAGTAGGVIAAGQVAKSVVGPPNETAEQVKEIIGKGGEVLSVTKEAIAIPKPGFWYELLHFVTSPEFVLAMAIAVAGAWVFVWWWQRSHKGAHP